MSVIIVGGGMTGATLALANSYLTNGQLPVHLIEAVVPQSLDHSGFDARAIALAKGSCQHFERIGIWQEIADFAMPIKTVYVRDRGHAGLVTLDAQDYRIDELGQVVELYGVRLRLFRLLQNAPGVTLHCPARVTSITRSESTISVTLDKGIVLEAELLVAADGSQSEMASQCGIQCRQQLYDQVAVIANVSTAVNHEGRAWELFTEHGPLAMLPMIHGRCSLVWCHPLDKKDEVLAWPDKHFCAELQKAFGWRLGRITHVGKRTAYSLELTTATQSITHRVVLVGNAAQTLHPIAGQGFNLGLRDVMSMAETLAQAWSRQQDCGAYSVLSYYQQRRQSDKVATIGVTDGLVRLFTNRWTPLVAGRNAGLMAMELFIPARNVLVQRTLGWVAR